LTDISVAAVAAVATVGGRTCTTVATGTARGRSTRALGNRGAAGTSCGSGPGRTVTTAAARTGDGHCPETTSRSVTAQPAGTAHTAGRRTTGATGTASCARPGDGRVSTVTADTTVGSGTVYAGGGPVATDTRNATGTAVTTVTTTEDSQRAGRVTAGTAMTTGTGVTASSAVAARYGLTCHHATGGGTVKGDKHLSSGRH
jgi:hypothetical protein